MAIDILLATFNGEKYVKSQIDSVVNQSYTDWNLIVRDDGSTDNTVKVIQGYVNKYENQIKLLSNENTNLGSSQNFHKLLSNSLSNYVMFCDQDDVWLPDKIKLVLEKMQVLEKQNGCDTPLLVHTNLEVVDQELKLLSSSFWNYHNLNPDTGKLLNRLLVRNVITGSTVMINKSLRNLSLPIPRTVVMYDWWIALVAAAFGKVAYIDAPTVLYRQHGMNNIGAQAWNLTYILFTIKRLSRVRAYYAKTIVQSKAFLESYDLQLDKDIFSVINTYSSLDQQNFFSKRFNIIKHKYFETGLIRNLGLFGII